MSKLEQKAKSLQQWMDEVTYIRQGKLLVPENPEQVKQRLVSFEVAEQEIDKLKTFRDNAYKKWCDSQAELERERGLQKQKLQPFYDTLVAMVPKTVKIEEYDKETKDSWIVQTADPSEWSMFIDSLDGWLVKFKEMLK